MVSDFVVAEVNLANVNGVALERLAQDNECLIVETISEIILVITEDGQINCIVLIVSFFQVSAKGFVCLDISLSAVFAILAEHVGLNQLSILNLLVFQIGRAHV